jgi:type IV pilus assembly protein PilN
MYSTVINEDQNKLNQMSSSEEEKKSVDIQLKFIIDLYNESYNAVRFLNELVNLVPNSISIVRVKRNGNEITLTGIAESEHDITRLLDDITKSPYFNQPTLSSINTDNKSSEGSRKFELMFEQKGS